jgi:hypothetical protein
MQERSIVERVEILERKVETLETLPDRVTRVELQLVQLRDEMRGEFSAIRGSAATEVTLSSLREEIRAGGDETRRTLREEIRGGDEETRWTLREEIRGGDEETRRVLREEIRIGDEETRRTLREEIRASNEETVRRLRDEIRAGDDETRRYMRVLHEEVIARLALIEEGRRARKNR